MRNVNRFGTGRSGGLVLAMSVGLMGGVGGSASADVADFEWGWATNAGGAYQLNYPTNMWIVGGNSGVQGDSSLTGSIYGKGSITLTGSYASSDGGTWDYFYIEINGVEQFRMYNKDQGGFSKSYNVQHGDVVKVGVYTADGAFGAGSVNFDSVNHVTWVDHFAGSCGWYLYDSGGAGSGSAPDPILVTGPNSGVGGRTDMWTYTQAAIAFAQAFGSYSSIDTVCYDNAYHYNNAMAMPTPPYHDFMCNNAQGSFTYPFTSTGGSLGALQEWGFGVKSTDGVFGPGILNIDDLVMDFHPGRVENHAWFVNPNGTNGTVQFPGGNQIWFWGGNNGVAGDTTSIVKSFHHYHVEAEVKYLSNDSGDWDHCFYSVNGKQTKIADNASQGTYKVAFDVCCGDEYGFGVHTKDGVAGEGLMSVTRFRAWALPECAKQTCYPDCDGDGALSIDDFICFQTFFALGDNYADCDGDGALSIDDFICFQTYFAIGC